MNDGTTMETTTSTVISIVKKKPAIFVETATPRTISTTASAVRISVQMIQGKLKLGK